MKPAFLILILTFFGLSCSPEMAEPGSSVGSDIKVSLREGISEEGRRLLIISETIEIFPCYNYYLITKQRFRGDEITMTYSGISIPEICLTALGPARSEEYFNLENGVYSITFINAGVPNVGQLAVDDEKYVLELQNPTNVFVQVGTVMKASENTP